MADQTMAGLGLTDALKQKLGPTGGVTGNGQYGLANAVAGTPPPAGPRPVTGPGLQAVTAPAAPTQPAPAPVPGVQPAAPAASAEPKPEGMSDQDWANFQARYRPPAGAPTSATPGAGTAGAPSPNPLGDVFRNALVSRISANPIPTAVGEDPALAAQSGAFRQAQERSASRARSQGAESLSASGLGSSGAAGSMARKVEADRALAEGQFDAGLLGDARQQRMQELQQFLSIAGNTLSNEQQTALQRELGLGDLNVRQQGVASQTALGQGDLALRGELGRGGLQQNLLSILLNNRTDNDRTALQGAGLELGANTAALQALLGR